MEKNPEKDKPAKKAERPVKYKEKLRVKGSFMDIIKVAVKHAEEKSIKKK